MSQTPQLLAIKRIYDVTTERGGHTLRLLDQAITLSHRGYAAFLAVERNLAGDRGASRSDVSEGSIAELKQAGIVFDVETNSEVLTGGAFHDRYFVGALRSWLREAFDHPFWALMVDGKGDRILFTGWLFELYHFTRNANKHMPLAAALAPTKALRQELSKHYAEEWNHYEYFSSALQALGFKAEEIEASQPLPMTLEMANFMRQAARKDILAYAACSAVLEGTTLDEEAYTSYYGTVARHYNIPREAIQPLFDHVELDKKYGHRSLFTCICEEISSISNDRADLILSYGHQMAEHIVAWTDNIQAYYSTPDAVVPRRSFDIAVD